jgi:hypothetical protein
VVLGFLKNEGGPLQEQRDKVLAELNELKKERRAKIEIKEEEEMGLPEK